MRQEATRQGSRTVQASPRPHTGELEVSEREQDGVRVLEVAGELDMSSAPSLCLRLDAARRVTRPRVLVDFTGLEFCDSTGLRALILAGQEITASAGRFGVVVPPGDGAVARMFAITSAAELFPLFPTSDDGLAALGTGG